MTQQEIDKLKEQNPGRELVSLSSSSAEVVAKLPTSLEMGSFRDRLNDKKLAGGAMEWLVRSCVVYPGREELNALLARRPLLVEKWYQKLEAEAGGQEEIELKKL